MTDQLLRKSSSTHSNQASFSCIFPELTYPEPTESILMFMKKDHRQNSFTGLNEKEMTNCSGFPPQMKTQPSSDSKAISG